MNISTLPATARIDAIRVLLRPMTPPKAKQAILDHLKAVEDELRGRG